MADLHVYVTAAWASKAQPAVLQTHIILRKFAHWPDAVVTVRFATSTSTLRIARLFCTPAHTHAGIVPAMLGALVLAQLMSAGGQGSPAYVIAYYLTTWMGKGYLGIAGGTNCIKCSSCEGCTRVLPGQLLLCCGLLLLSGQRC